MRQQRPQDCRLTVIRLYLKEMVDMITITRAYEAGQKIVQTMDDTLDKSVNEIGRL